MTGDDRCAVELSERIRAPDAAAEWLLLALGTWMWDSPWRRNGRVQSSLGRGEEAP
jgi:hypothetical protein